ncbi:MAG: Phosphatidylglycerophosphatase A [Alphaproteobacteria bacterium ADurb.Bin438]|nr:MAG: Phosphatidylglycerophosphatase A [Alphaproteobacteria bacterium ADurb.Bin438]
MIDEVLGQLTTFVFIAHSLKGTFDNAWLYLVGFAFFRLFDICKFGLVKWADEKLENEYGVMLDDLFAGIFAGLVLFLINYFL